MSELKKQVLGRGLSSLLDPSLEEDKVKGDSSPIEISMMLIEPGVNQPRRSFSEGELQALSISIQEKGVLQPILVRPHPREEGKYEIVAGERRWRAAKRAHFETIPALIREFSDREALEVGLLENLQRQDLDPIDEAAGYRRLAEEFDHTQESLSRIVGKSRSHIANTLRLLTLPESVQNSLKNGELSAGHGRTLVGTENPEYLAARIIEKNLNVRQAETLSRQGASKRHYTFSSTPSDPEKEVLCQHLSELLSVSVELTLKGQGGKIVINFKTPDELDQIIQKFNKLEKASSSPPFAIYSA